MHSLKCARVQEFFFSPLVLSKKLILNGQWSTTMCRRMEYSYHTLTASILLGLFSLLMRWRLRHEQKIIKILNKSKGSKEKAIRQNWKWLMFNVIT